MAYQARQRDPLFDRDTQAVLERRGKELLGALLIAIAVIAAMILGSYSQDDPSWMSITNEPAQNLLGRFGATVAQPVYVIVGWGGWMVPLLFAAWGLRFLLHRGEELAMSRATFGPIAVAMASIYAATHVPSATWTHSFGMGGMLGDTVLGAVLNFLPFDSGFGLKLIALVMMAALISVSLFSMGATKPELQAVGRFLLLSLVMTYAALLRWTSAIVEFVLRITRSGGGATLRGGMSLAAKAADWQAARKAAKAEAPVRRSAPLAQAQAYDEVFEDDDGYDYAPEPASVQPVRRTAQVVRSQVQPERQPVPRYEPEDEIAFDDAGYSAYEQAPRRAAPRPAAQSYSAAPRQESRPEPSDWASAEPPRAVSQTGYQAIDAYQPVQRVQQKPSLLSRVPSFLMRQVAPAAAAPAAAPMPAMPQPELIKQPDIYDDAPVSAQRDDHLSAKIANAISARRQQVTAAPLRAEPPVSRPKGPRPILFDPSKYPTGRAARAETAPQAAAQTYAPPQAAAFDAAEAQPQTAAFDYAAPQQAAAPRMARAEAPRYDEAFEPEYDAPTMVDLAEGELHLDASAFEQDFAPAPQPRAEVQPEPAPAPLVKPRVSLRATAATSPSPAEATEPAERAAPPAASSSRLIRTGQDAGAFAAVQGLDQGDDEDDEDDLPFDAAPEPQNFVVETKKVVQHPLQRQVLPSKQARAEAQPRQRFEDRHPGFEKPPLALLMSPEEVERHMLSDDQLEENARLLETVLDDYGVRGEIVSVRPGPVVTMYELEPAPGLKASRVIGLSDDIARSMKALSARVSTVPGRSVIGIELPNERREKVVLREIISARDFGDTNMRLPLALGKDIGGEPVVANLAKMPHLLIAGTTGSGKSVAINTMILSLLYRLTPEECRLIMIDPKMLELSVYDGIPHLLSPVVTDPKKAVVALKWVVGEMEERYRKMSKMGVRNIEGYNGRVRDALAKGEMFKRTIQTGFDEETGDPVFETDEFEPQPFPYIVVIVDEMADLMMVAGKEIEACIQRLAQMARASGIHLIMATQRPSVDVITGTIKANFPTRISFQVTSKIDSRTILGEMGAEQLLGMGDMLYMAGGGRISRVHGPFVSDEEVEEVVNHLKSFGPPEYIGSVVEGPDDSERSEGGTSVDELLGLSTEKEGDEALYDMAVAIVAKDRKCSTSYIQRKLAIGYNKAARLVEQMEDQGIVSRANHVGKREILVPEVQ